MIPRAAITAWGSSVGWASDEQVEQDLLLSRLIIEIANDPYLGEELVFRGGTCLHKLYADRPYRYSEDSRAGRPRRGRDARPATGAPLVGAATRRRPRDWASRAPTPDVGERDLQ